MTSETYEIYSTSGTRLFAQSWSPDKDVKAVLFIVHGLGEHSGRYEEFAEYATKQGIAVFAFDHRGHGTITFRRWGF